MKCDRVKDVIIDYVDGEVNEVLRQEIASHLDACPDCKRMADDLKGAVLGPLKSSRRHEPSREVWHRIKDALEGEKVRAVLSFPALDWAGIFRVRRPAFALAFVAVVLCVAAFFVGTTRVSRNGIEPYVQDGELFLAYLEGDAQADDADAYDNGLGTSIEKYLL